MDVQICGEHSGAAEEKPLYRRSAIGDRTLMAAVGGGFFSFYSPSSLSLLFFFVFSLSLSLAFGFVIACCPSLNGPVGLVYHLLLDGLALSFFLDKEGRENPVKLGKQKKNGPLRSTPCSSPSARVLGNNRDKTSPWLDSERHQQ